MSSSALPLVSAMNLITRVVHLHRVDGLPERRCPVPAGRRQRHRLPAVPGQRLPHRRRRPARGLPTEHGSAGAGEPGGLPARRPQARDARHRDRPTSPLVVEERRRTHGREGLDPPRRGGRQLRADRRDHRLRRRPPFRLWLHAGRRRRDVLPFTIDADIYASLRTDAKTLFHTQRSGSRSSTR